MNSAGFTFFLLFAWLSEKMNSIKRLSSRFSVSAKVTPPSSNGIKLSGIQSFITSCGGREAFIGMTSGDVCERFIRPVTCKSNITFCEWIISNDDASVIGSANAYICHSWGDNFLGLVDIMIDHFVDEHDENYLWFDIFSFNQNATAIAVLNESLHDWCLPFKDLIANIGRTIVLFMPQWSQPTGIHVVYDGISCTYYMTFMCVNVPFI